MNLKRLSKADLAVIAEAEAMNDELHHIHNTSAFTDEEAIAQNLAIAEITGGPVEVEIIGGDCMGPEYASDEQIAAAVTELEQATPMSASLEEVVAQLEAVDEAQAAVQSTLAIEVHEAPAEAVHAAPATGEPGDALDAWNKVIDAIGKDEAIAMALKVSAAIDERKAFELAKDPNNANIQRTLKKAAAQLSMPSACKAMEVTGFELGQLNRVKNAGSRYNVYAFGKLADVLNGVVNGAIGNKINNACLRSLLKCHKAGITFTMETAKLAASDKIRVTDKNLAACLVRHTVSASTAPTQASSTMQALTDLGIVSRGGSEKQPIFSLTSAPIVAKLESILA